MSLTQNDKLPHKASIIQYCDTQRNPIAVEQKPRLSWRIADVPDGYMQTAYRIRVASCREKLAMCCRTYVWTSSFPPRCRAPPATGGPWMSGIRTA